MAGIKSLVGRKMTKNIKFMNEDISISKLSVSEVVNIQAKAKEVETSDNGLELLKAVIKASVAGAEDLTDSDFDNFPLDELSKLSTEIMKFSGIGQDQGK